MSSNRYAARCVRCSMIVPVGEGDLRKVGRSWEVNHKVSCPAMVPVAECRGCEDCDGEGGEMCASIQASRTDRDPRNVSMVARFASGAVTYVNRRGRCIDAPCCGCCS